MDIWPEDTSTWGLFSYTFGEISIWPYMHAMSNYFVYMYLRDWSISMLFALVWEMYEVFVYMLYEHNNPNFELETPFASYVGDGFQAIVSIIVAQTFCSCLAIRKPLFLGETEPLPFHTHNNSDTLNAMLKQVLRSLFLPHKTYRSPAGSASRRWLKFVVYIVLFVIANMAVQLDPLRPHWFTILCMMFGYTAAGMAFHIFLIPDLTALGWSVSEQIRFWVAAQFLPQIVWGLVSIQNTISSYIPLWIVDIAFIVGALVWFRFRGRRNRTEISKRVASLRVQREEEEGGTLAGQELMRKAVHGWGNEMLLKLERDAKKSHASDSIIEDSVSLTNDSAEEDLPEEFFTKATTSNKGDEEESVDSENQLIVEKLDTRVNFEVASIGGIDISAQE